MKRRESLDPAGEVDRWEKDAKWEERIEWCQKGKAKPWKDK